MKKSINIKKLAIISVALVALLVAAVFSISLAAPTVAYAYSEADVQTNEQAEAQVAAEEAAEQTEDEIYYYDAISSRSGQTETFEYATKTSEYYYINGNFPECYNSNANITNTCANVAGANVISYYDRYYEELIPNATPGYYPHEDIYYYFPMAVNKAANQAVINDLYTRMKTNVERDGTTQANYESGIASYALTKELNTSYISVMTGNYFDLNKAKVQLKNGNPISLYLSKYGFTEVTDNGSSVTYDKYLFEGNHIAIAYGYEKVNYYKADGSLLRSVIYLDVSTGMHDVTGVYIINDYGTLIDAQAVHIY